MVIGFLAFAGLMAVVAGDVGAAVLAALELMNHSRGLLVVTLRATPGRANQFRQRLVDVGPRPCAMEQ